MEWEWGSERDANSDDDGALQDMYFNTASKYIDTNDIFLSHLSGRAGSPVAFTLRRCQRNNLAFLTLLYLSDSVNLYRASCWMISYSLYMLYIIAQTVNVPKIKV